MERIRTRASRARTPKPDASTAALDAVRLLVRKLRLGSHEAERDVGLSSAQIFVLRQIAQNPSSALKDIARATLTDQSSVSVVVARLVERGLVKRRTAADDGRRAELTLTPAGRRVLDRAPVSPQARMIDAFRKLSAAEARGIARGLERVLDEMNDGDGTPLDGDGADAAAARRRAKR